MIGSMSFGHGAKANWAQVWVLDSGPQAFGQNQDGKPRN